MTRTLVLAICAAFLLAIAPGCGTTRAYWGLDHEYEYDWDGYSYGGKHHKPKKHKKPKKHHKKHHDRHHHHHDDDDD